MVPGAAFADEPPTGNDLEGIVVTAQRREQNAQDVGISLTALSGWELREMNIHTSLDIARLTPGVHMSGSLGGQSVNFTIRGVTQSDFNDAIEAPVAVYVDDTYIPSLQGQGFGLFDIERVEVLKGPQGTLFGRNATGGLVHYVVAKPTDTFEGYVEGTYGRFNQTKLEGAVSGPITDRLTGRASFYFNRHEAILKNVWPDGLAPGFPTGLGPDISPCCADEWNDDTLAGRVQLQYEPSDDWRIRLVGSAARQNLSTAPYNTIATVPVLDAQGRLVNAILAGPDETRVAIGPNGENVTSIPGSPPFRLPGRDWLGFLPFDGKDLTVSKEYARDNLNHTRSYAADLHIDGDLGGDVSLVAVSSWKQFKKAFYMDAEASPVNFLTISALANTKSFSQEVRVSGGDAVKWSTGVYYLHIDAHTEGGILAPRGSIFASLFGAAATGIDLPNIVRLRTDSYSVFGQGEYEFAPRWTVILGGRLIREKQKYDFLSYAFANDDDYSLDTTTPLFELQPPFNDARGKTLWAGKAQLEYRPNDDLLIYVGVNRGVKGGSYNAKLADGSPPLPPADIPYRPEVLLSYEGGFKSSFADGAVTFNASAYYYDYSDYQAFTFQNVSGYVQNRDAEVYGVETELEARPVDGLTVSLAFSAFHARVKDVQIAPDLFRDVRPAYAPSTQVALRLYYEAPWDVFGGRMSFGVDGSYTSSFYNNIRNFDSTLMKSYVLMNMRVAWQTLDERFKLTLFLDNVTDKRYGTIGFEGSTVCGCNEIAYGRPRWWGITATSRF